jgi:DNA end-binding protein Ku
MALRSTWKGYLKLSLVSCAVALYPAATSTSSERVSFHVLDNELTAIRIESSHTIDIDAQRGAALHLGNKKRRARRWRQTRLQTGQRGASGLRQERTTRTRSRLA